MHYFQFILTLFAPFIDVTTDQTPNPSEIILNARKSLEIIIRLYYLRHGFDAMDLFIVFPLMVIGIDCLDTLNEKKLRGRPDS